MVVQRVPVGTHMDGTRLDGLLPGGDSTPLVRATRSQAEIRLLPPFGDPEVNIAGEVATYVLAGGIAAAVLDVLQD